MTQGFELKAYKNIPTYTYISVAQDKKTEIGIYS